MCFFTAAVCNPGYGVPKSVFGLPVWRCYRRRLGFYSAGNTTTACSKCGEGMTTAREGATAPEECIPAVCDDLPREAPGIAAWPAACKGKSSCTTDCSGGWTGSVTVVRGADKTWGQPQQNCSADKVPQNFTGQPSLSPANIIVNSDAAITFTMKFTTELPAAAGHVSLFSSTGHINPELHLKDMQQSVTRRSHSAPAAAGVTSVSPRGSSYTAILQGAALRNLSNSPGVLHFTAVLGADDQPTGITAELQLLTGCASAPTDAPPTGALGPWAGKDCSNAAVGAQCFTSCNWPAYDGSGYYVTCLPDGSWSGPGGFCFPTSCTGSPGPEWAASNCEFMHIGARCTAPCPQDVFTSGSGYVAECTLSGWQVMSRDCSMSQPDVCNDLPTPGPPFWQQGLEFQLCWPECG
uniref:Sushi domain-containing protein n=1 Tax=Tetradesmus obliquus TaxID=3088 RepID=A0A383V6H4_TETOB|eukprot:jgi/Sobl393_1/6205/SZX59946.1